MPADSPVTAAQLLQISAGFASLGDAARSILSDDTVTLSVNQSNLISADMTALYGYAASVATLAAKIAFDDSDAAFAAMSSATQSGADALAALQTKAGRVDKICNILAAGVNLGVAIGSGSAGSILSGAVALHEAAA